MGERHPGTNRRCWLPICIGTLLVLGQPAFAQDRACAVAEVAGAASLTHAGARTNVQVGTELAARDVLQTGPSGRVDVACSDGTRVTLGPDTQVGLGSLVGEQADDASIGMSLHRGIARFLAPIRTWGSFNVFGPVAVASVRSTEWIMETPKRGTNVFVLAGTVDVLGKRGDNVRLSPTYGVDVTADGTMGEAKVWGAQRVANALARLGL
ncbi:FecR family protein [Dongia deserti]|uniref:FecR family protein n=1 Tax=Dongia deserti TaxID=2268030 RepID=UPI0013C4C630|nr:FecR family protein [Dongia deserti]